MPQRVAPLLHFDLNESPIEYVHEFNFLGLTLDSSLSFKFHLLIKIGNNNNNKIYLYCRHTVHIHIKKKLNIYKNSNNNNIISQRKIVLINITLISTIAEWESEYKQ